MRDTPTVTVFECANVIAFILKNLFTLIFAFHKKTEPFKIKCISQSRGFNTKDQDNKTFAERL